VRVHDEGVRALPEEMVENVEEDWPAAEREEGFGRVSVSGRKRVPKPAARTRAIIRLEG